MSHAELTRYARAEYPEARQQLETRPVLEAQVLFFQRLDLALSSAIKSSHHTIACQSGCDYCCHYKIEALPTEILAIKQHVVSQFKSDILRRVMDQAKRNVEQSKHLTHVEQLSINQPCPFLIDRQCSVYSVRPSNCRIYHATDLTACKQSFDHPTETIPNTLVESIKDAGGGSAEGFEQAVKSAGMDTQLYDLSSAFLEAMQNATLPKRLKTGKKVFVVAKVVNR